jgi:RNA recognition motif-containing protein
MDQMFPSSSFVARRRNRRNNGYNLNNVNSKDNDNNKEAVTSRTALKSSISWSSRNGFESSVSESYGLTDLIKDRQPRLQEERSLQQHHEAAPTEHRQTTVQQLLEGHSLFQEDKTTSTTSIMLSRPVSRRGLSVTTKDSGTKKGAYTMFVGNLSYDITAEEVTRLFNRSGKVESVSVPSNKKKQHSRGFAFVSMTTRSGQEHAIEKLHGYQWNGRRIRVSKAEKNNKEDFLANVKLTKLYVGNVSPSTTEQDLSVLFGKHGDVKDVILPIHHLSGEPKGYAFIMMNDNDCEATIQGVNGHDCNGYTLAVREANRRTRTTFFVGGLSYWTPVDVVKALFETYESNAECRTPGNCKFCRGSALVTMDQSDAFHAMREAHGSVIDGRVVRVEQYIPREQRRLVPVSRMKSLKSTKDSNTSVTHRKEIATEDGWNKKFDFVPPAFKYWMKYLNMSIHKNMHHP